ncbi:MAG: N-6 DNA methylase [Archangium sp.]|nr:N-6 DNA methylase [Archangium sp.]
MDLEEALSELGFADSPNYLRVPRLRFGDARSYAFRKAISTCALKGAYFVAGNSPTKSPVVLVTEADSVEEAAGVHQRIWNQNLAPLLLVNTPKELRLYHAYRPPDRGSGPQAALIAIADTVESISRTLRVAHAKSIDSGDLWANATVRSDPTRRVDTKLLKNLDGLVKLMTEHGVHATIAYSLIGKLLFIKYLRDRDILSNRKLFEFGLDEASSIGARLEMPKFAHLVDETEKWLGGHVFPLPLSAIPESLLKMVTASLNGHDVSDGQLGLDFSLFDFSHIPIETLSSVYQKLLHSTDAGRELGAYYTPATLIEFVLDEVQDLCPLDRSTTVFDPSCGSGAFLVFAYRRFIEEQLRKTRSTNISPKELRTILTTRVFGVDTDSGACSVARLSLLLTMLDYVDPPDLVSTPRFRLPDLGEGNVVQADFFDPKPSADSPVLRTFDWVVGNPPWFQTNGEEGANSDSHALTWIRANAARKPVASNQLAEAFSWKALDNIADNGAFGLVIPAISLFKSNPRFLQELSRAVRLSTISNFSAFAGLLFEGASTAAATLVGSAKSPRATDEVLLFNPLPINQPGTVDRSGNRALPSSIVINRSEIKRIPNSEVSLGNSTRWKALVFGSMRDARLLESLESRLPTFGDWLESKKLVMMEGPQLRSERSKDRLLAVPKLKGAMEFSLEELRGAGRWHSVPPAALRPIPNSRAFLRVRGGVSPLAICQPPHVIVSAALTFAVFSEEFFVVPPRQIGIAGDDVASLRLAALFLSSSWVRYHQFFASPQGGVRGGRTTLKALRQLPCPLGRLSAGDQKKWLDLHQLRRDLGRGAEDDSEINDFVFDALKLDALSRTLIEEFIAVYMPLSYGTGEAVAGRTPTRDELKVYAETLSTMLSAHQGGGLGVCDVEVSLADSYGLTTIRIADRAKPRVHVDYDARLPQLTIFESKPDDPQWAYLDRNLLVTSENERIFFKPLQFLWWTRSQAIADAERLVIESVGGEFDESAQRLQ